MLRALPLLVALGACGPASAPPPPPAPPAAPAPATLDGLVIWPTPLTSAPPAVRDYITLTAGLLDTYAAAPRPTVEYRADGDAWLRWQDGTRPYFETFQARVTAYMQAHDASAPITGLSSADETRLYHVTLQLIESHARARYFSELRLGAPAFGSCHGSPDEAFGHALDDTRDAAFECLTLISALTSSPFAANDAECSRRLAWAKTLSATGIEGVCEPPQPGD